MKINEGNLILQRDGLLRGATHINLGDLRI